jgi:8-oxo-dGTP diphosphatase
MQSRAFGVRIAGITYTDRPGAYAIILDGSGDRVATVRTKAGRLFLPGGGVEPGESPEHALKREIMEECGWHARILGWIGRATQYVSAAGEGHFAIHATYFRARLLDQQVVDCEHEFAWLPARDTCDLLARENDR